MKRITRKEWLMLLTPVAAVLLLFLPAPTGELEVRKHIFVSGHPVLALTAEVNKSGRIDRDYGYLYQVDAIEDSFVYVKKTSLGWRYSESGSGP